jgi:hypothetical protein
VEANERVSLLSFEGGEVEVDIELSTL